MRRTAYQLAERCQLLGLNKLFLQSFEVVEGTARSVQKLRQLVSQQALTPENHNAHHDHGGKTHPDAGSLDGIWKCGPELSLDRRPQQAEEREHAEARDPAAEVAKILSSFDAEVLEIHHGTKVDAPSGTALALGRVIAEARGLDFKSSAVFGREGITGVRSPDKIAVFGLRAGDAVGDHTVYFGGQGERLELTHRAQSRESLARGALRAAAWVEQRPPGLYSMRDVLGL